MDLSLEVKGYIQDALATKIYSWDKIKTFGKRVGVDTSFFDEKRKSDANFNKRMACEYIIDNIPEGRGELVIKTLIDMAKRGQWDRDYSKEILAEINPIMEATMNCRVDENGKIIDLEEREKFIPQGRKIKGENIIEDRLENQTREYVKICDQYFQASAVGLLEVVPKGTHIKILTENTGGEGKERRLLRKLQELQQLRRVRVEIRKIKPFPAHMRYIITKGKAWHLSHSLKDFGRRDSFLQEVKEKLEELEQRFDELWKKGTPVYLESTLPQNLRQKAIEGLMIKKFCTYCGLPNTRKLKFCPWCGTKLLKE
jgi:hypothetical protein